MILEEIKNKLKGIEPKVYYGVVSEEVRETVWDCIVFGRVSSRATQNRTGFSDYFDVAIIKENFIPEGTDSDVIAKMLEIEGMRQTAEESTYTYLKKPNTEVVVEIETLHFVRARK